MTRDALSRIDTYRHTSGAWVQVDPDLVRDRLPQLFEVLDGIAKGGGALVLEGGDVRQGEHRWC